MGEANRRQFGMPGQTEEERIAAHHKAVMRVVASNVEAGLNGRAKGADRKVGFTILVYPMPNTDGGCDMISNGASDAEVMMLFRTMLARMEGQAATAGSA